MAAVPLTLPAHTRTWHGLCKVQPLLQLIMKIVLTRVRVLRPLTRIRRAAVPYERAEAIAEAQGNPRESRRTGLRPHGTHLAGEGGVGKSGAALLAPGGGKEAPQQSWGLAPHLTRPHTPPPRPHTGCSCALTPPLLAPAHAYHHIAAMPTLIIIEAATGAIVEKDGRTKVTVAKTLTGIVSK
jgi:hypothetical protein